MTTLDTAHLRDADEMEAMLRRIGAERYHIHHPFHRLLHGGRLAKGQVRAVPGDDMPSQRSFVHQIFGLAA